MIKLHRIGIFSMGKVSGVYGAIFGLLGGLLMTGFSLLGILLGGGLDRGYSSTAAYSSIFGIINGVGAVICLPIIYGIFGFIGGIISAFFLNLALKFAGGLELEAIGFSLQPAPPQEAQRKIEPPGPLTQ